MALLVAVYDNGINATGWNRSWYVDIVTWLGRISYGLYVYHSFPMEIAKDLFPILTTGNPLQTGSIILTQLAFTVVVTVLLAAISYEFLEKPFLRIKDRFSVVSSTPTSEGAAKANGSKSTAAIVGD